jgi:hypothetical protein
MALLDARLPATRVADAASVSGAAGVSRAGSGM